MAKTHFTFPEAQSQELAIPPMITFDSIMGKFYDNKEKHGPSSGNYEMPLENRMILEERSAGRQNSLACGLPSGKSSRGSDSMFLVGRQSFHFADASIFAVAEDAQLLLGLAVLVR